MIKQVIVVRKDLKMGKGKLAAQVAHASMAFISDSIEIEGYDFILNINEDAKEWLIEGPFIKIVLGCDSKKELIELYKKANKNGLYCSLIIDSGKTEFNGKRTVTTMAIGPTEASRIDEITGNLKLL